MIVLDQRTEWPMQIKVAGRRKLLSRAKFDASRKTFSVTSTANKEEFSDTSLVKPDEPGDSMANLAALMDVQLAVSFDLEKRKCFWKTSSSWVSDPSSS
jgi:hypothetical protein